MEPVGGIMDLIGGDMGPGMLNIDIGRMMDIDIGRMMDVDHLDMDPE
jgi:hypothetical protein